MDGRLGEYKLGDPDPWKGMPRLEVEEGSAPVSVVHVFKGSEVSLESGPDPVEIDGKPYWSIWLRDRKGAMEQILIPNKGTAPVVRRYGLLDPKGTVLSPIPPVVPPVSKPTVKKGWDEIIREIIKALEKSEKTGSKVATLGGKPGIRGMTGSTGGLGSLLGSAFGSTKGRGGMAGPLGRGGSRNGSGGSSTLAGGGSSGSTDRDPFGGGRESSWKPSGKTPTVSVGDGSAGGSSGAPSGSSDDDLGDDDVGDTDESTDPSRERGGGKGDTKSGDRKGASHGSGGTEEGEGEETEGDGDETNTRGTPNPMDDGTSLSAAGDPISAVVTFGATRLALAQAGTYRGPRSDGALNDDSSLASADIDWSMVGFDPTIDPTPYAGAALAGGMGPAAIRDDYTGAVSATNGGGGSTGGLRPSAVGVGGGPILAFRPDVDSPTDRGKVDEATMLVDRFTTIPGSSGDTPGSGGDPAAMRSSTPAVGGSGSTIGTIGGMTLLGAAMVSIDRGVGKVQPGAVAGTYRRK